MVRLEHATQEHVDLIAPDIRQADIDEIYASSGLDIHTALSIGIKTEGQHYAGFIDDEIVSIFGVSTYEDAGIVWLVSTEEITKHMMIIGRYSKGFIDKCKRKYNYLFNYVDTKNIMAIKWLEWLGFTIHDAEYHGFLQMPFHKFDMEVF